jgi:hypothetical protein
VTEAVLKQVKTGTADTLSFQIPKDLRQRFADEIKKGKGFYHVRISIPRRGRTTGEGSQNHHINGHVAQIAEETGNDFQDVKDGAKLRAIKRGYPYDTLPNGWIVPKSESDLDTVQAGYLTEELHQIAAELGINLRESE